MDATYWIICQAALGLAAFVIGMKALSGGLRRLAGAFPTRLFTYLDRRPLPAFILSALITAAWHSSSATTIMVVGMAESGILGTAPAIAAILGANLGTTATSQMFTLSLEEISPVLILIGLVCLALSRVPIRNRGARRLLMGTGVALAGFGLLFTGLDLLSRSAQVFRTREWFTRLLLKDANRPVEGILYGALATMLIQSSTLLVGLVMSLADQGAVTLQGAVHLVLGSNIGTAIPTLVAGLALGPAGRRMAYVNLLFNLFGVVFFLPWLKPFVAFVATTSSVPIRQVANSHGLFNLLTAAVGLPLVGPWARQLERGFAPSRKPPVAGRTIAKGRKG